MDQDVTKKLEVLDGPVVPVGYDTPKGESGNLVIEASKCLEQNIDGWTDGTDGNTKVDHHTLMNNWSVSRRSADNHVKVNVRMSPTAKVEPNDNCINITGTAPTAGFARVSLGIPYGKVGISTAFVAPSAGAGLPFDSMVLDERQMKREKRKQANRESARRSRMRKQAEYEELVTTCESFKTEKMTLESELEVMKGVYEKLKLENAALREKLKSAEPVQQGGIASVKIEVDLDLQNGTENIGSNLGTVSRIAQLDCETHESSISETKFHQQLESSSRTDAVAAR